MQVDEIADFAVCWMIAHTPSILRFSLLRWYYSASDLLLYTLAACCTTIEGKTSPVICAVSHVIIELWITGVTGDGYDRGSQV